VTLNTVDYQQQARDAIRAFWGNRHAALEKQKALGRVDAGTRGAVTAGNNLDGFRALFLELVRANGLGHADVYTDKGTVVLPGYFRPTKQWDTLIMVGTRLVVNRQEVVS
jgi:type II restriction enzyme